MRVHNAPGEVQPQSQPRDLVISLVRCPAKAGEDQLLILRGNARPRIDHLDPDPILALPPPGAQLDGRAGWGVLGGVGDQVAQDLRDATGIDRRW